MGKKKARLSLFSTIVQQITEQDPKLTSNDYHLIDNEYFPAFNSIDDIEKFHHKLTEKQQGQSIDMNSDEEEKNYDIDMKSFAQQFLVDLPENINQSEDLSTVKDSIPSQDNKKRKSTTPIKRNIETKKQRRNVRDLQQSSDFIFNEENSIIKNEPIEKEDQNTTLNPSNLSGGLDNYVQNIHLLHQQQSDSISPSRPKRIRKQKKFFSDEPEPIPRPRKIIKTSFRKKRSSLQLTDAQIEQQFGELLPTVKNELDDDTQQIINSRVVIDFEPVNPLPPQTPIEKARAKLLTALGRGHEPDTYLLKIRSREHKLIEVQLAIYSTTDWYSHRTKILSKIEEALRGLRVSWTKIDIHVDDFDVQISTSTSVSPPSSITNINSSWFLKALSESDPLIVHIHDRRYPQQRFLIKCSCPECSPTLTESSLNSSLPIIVNVSPATTPTRRLTPPSILHKTSQTNVSSLHNIETTFFNELISQCGKNTIISVTQCVLDLALIVSVHTSLPSLSMISKNSKEEFRKKYQQIIDPLNENEQDMTSINSISPDILIFYNSIQQNKANIRSAKSMRDLIQTELTNRSFQYKSSRSYIDHNEPKQQAHCTPIIELRPIMGGSTQTISSFTRDQNEKLINHDELKKVTTIISTPEMNSSTSNSARVIRFSITKSALNTSTSPPAIRLVPSSKTETVPLIPKQINIIKPLTSSITPAVKLSNPILISKSSK